MKIKTVRAIPMSDPIPPEKRHRTDIGTKVKTDAALLLVALGYAASERSRTGLRVGATDYDVTKTLLIGHEPAADQLRAKRFAGLNQQLAQLLQQVKTYSTM